MAQGPSFPLPSHPKPKSKGKKPKTPKLKPGPTIKPMDVFNTAMHADAGAESYHDPNVLYEFINQMSHSQLKKMDKLVQKIQARILDNKEEQNRQQAVCKKISDATFKRRQQSIKAEISLKLKVKKRLAKLKLSHIERSSSGKIQALHVEEKRVTVKVFLKRYLSDELRLVDELMHDGTLLPQRMRQRPLSFLESLLNACL